MRSIQPNTAGNQTHNKNCNSDFKVSCCSFVELYLCHNSWHFEPKLDFKLNYSLHNKKFLKYTLCASKKKHFLCLKYQISRSGLWHKYNSICIQKTYRNPCSLITLFERERQCLYFSIQKSLFVEIDATSINTNRSKMWNQICALCCLYSVVCGLTCKHQISAFTYFDTKKMAEFVSSTLGSALLIFPLFVGFYYLRYWWASHNAPQYSVFKAKKRSWNTDVFIWIKTETNTLMAHKSR